MSDSSMATMLEHDAKPPKSKSAAYYAIHPTWQDVEPIPQADQTGALAAIAYSPRYAEAMSYLRAVMAANEVSDRALLLSEDLIGMNPAHYTVWIYRMRVLQALWEGQMTDDNSSHVLGEKGSDVDPQLWSHIQTELAWLDDVSFKNLKNYQIWHHRQSLANLLPTNPLSLNANSTESQDYASSPATTFTGSTRDEIAKFIASEQRFLAQILSLDTKNYHVWSYRQWLCTRFPSILLPVAPHQPPYTSKDIPITANTNQYRNHSEVQAMDVMIQDDVRNNSAWSHRYYILFGHHESNYAQHQKPPLILKQVNEQRLLHKANLVDMNMVDVEIVYTKEQILKAPQNGSAWNYLRGVLRHGAKDLSSVKEFCEGFLGPDGDLWTDQWIDVELEDAETREKRNEKQELGVRSSHAVEWLAEIYSQTGTEEGKRRSKECLKALSEKWDPIRRAYWNHLQTQN